MPNSYDPDEPEMQWLTDLFDDLVTTLVGLLTGLVRGIIGIFRH